MIDPICGMEVDPSDATESHIYNGQIYLFCSHHCVTKFKEDPEKFLKRWASEHGASAHEHEQVHLDPQIPQDKAEHGYVCPMDPEVHSVQPGPCPKCGMALEPATPVAPSFKTEYVCPMHPEIVRPEPGSCPVCGMALEPRTVTLQEETNPELVDMTRRFWISLVLTAPIFFLAMSDMIPGQPVQRIISPKLLNWGQLVLATPIVLWGGWPFFQRGWASIVNRSLNMFTLIAEVLPERKIEVIRDLQRKGRMVAMAGDGVNDAPALAQAHVGIAMGTGTHVAIESARVTLVKGDLRGIAKARRLSQGTMRNIRENLFFAFVYNMLGIPIAAGALYPFFGMLLSPVIASVAMTFSSVSVITNALRLNRLQL